jgi:hemerythrin-like domain-containing protein
LSHRISQTLHDEHRATIAIMERLEEFIGRRAPASLGDPAASRLLRDLVDAVEQDTSRHFDFEEAHLFPLFQSVGDQLIGDHLTEEHSFMRPVGEKLATLARAAQREGFDPAGWREFQRAAAEFAQRMVLHVQKEEMALLPLIDDLLDATTELRLRKIYVRDMEPGAR